MARGSSGTIQPTTDFQCGYCKRPSECRGLPTIEEDGSPMEEADIDQVYHDRRYEHYLNDFDNTHDLKEHLKDRIRYWMQGSTAAEVEMAMGGIPATIGWWVNARAARRDITPRQIQLDEAKAALRRAAVVEEQVEIRNARADRLNQAFEESLSEKETVTTEE